MANPNDLPHLLKLLEDEDSYTRKIILEEILAFGADLNDELAIMHPPISKKHRFLINSLIDFDSQRAKKVPREGAFNARFGIGRIIKHRSYTYRGVIVSSDPMCLADIHWYNSNQTKPDIHQPWYHILVDDSLGISYVAESNLKLDPEPSLISHPIVGVYFESYKNGTYLRNNRPWLK